MIKIYYNACPNVPRNVAHLMSFHKCTEQRCETFNTAEEAVCFWMECVSPITNIRDIKCPYPELERVNILENLLFAN